MQKLLIAGAFLVVFFVMALNTSMIADQAGQWVKKNPKDPHAPQVLFYTGRYCDILGDNNRAQLVYQSLYEQYPEDTALAAAALYYEADNKIETSAATKAYAVPLLDTIINQYANEEEWVKKAKTLRDEVTYVR
jgi:hypothetical protein